MKDIQLIENKSEIGAGTRGASLGIDALKIASLNAGSDYFKRYPSVSVDDHNDLLWEENPTPTAIHIEGVIKVFESVSKEVKKSVESGRFPLVLAADHASAGGTIAGIKAAYPEKRLGVVWIDAHGDLHSPFTSPSGNMHGMPLATALSEDNKECQQLHPTPRAEELWNKIKSLGGIQPKLLPQDLVFFGVRDTEEPEEYLMKEKAIKNFTVEECRMKGIAAVSAEALGRLSDCDLIYISFDVDSMDPDIVSYGTGTPVQEGFKPQEAEAIIERLIVDSKKVACFELVEVNPTLDNKRNKMAETAFHILEKSTHLIAEYAF